MSEIDQIRYQQFLADQQAHAPSVVRAVGVGAGTYLALTAAQALVRYNQQHQTLQQEPAQTYQARGSLTIFFWALFVGLPALALVLFMVYNLIINN